MMNKLPRTHMMEFSLLLLCIFMNTTYAAMPKNVAFATVDSPPNHIQVAGEAEGPAVDALNCIMLKMKQSYTISFLPWRRAQTLVEMGRYDAFFLASRNDGRDAFAVLSEPIDRQTWNIYFLASKPFKNIDDIKARAKMGVKSNTSKERWLKKNNFNIVMNPYRDAPLISGLVNGRIDAFIGAEHMIENELSMPDYNREKLSHILVKKKSSGVYFGKKFLSQFPNFIEVFNRQVAQCQMRP